MGGKLVDFELKNVRFMLSTELPSDILTLLGRTGLPPLYSNYRYFKGLYFSGSARG